jgi:hypothetical protein
MNRRDYLIIYVIGLILFGLMASFQDSPGYMDADYYFMGGLRLADGQGFTEEILWNYLDDPSGIPHPSHAYWMPAASILSAVGMLLLRSRTFVAAQVPFVLLAALLPPLTARLAASFTNQRKLAILSSLFALFSVFYLVYFSTSDVFGISMLCGALFFIIVGLDWRQTKTQLGYAFLCGLLIGVLHLSRTEGLLWFAMAVLTIYWKEKDQAHDQRIIWRVIQASLSCGFGYLLIMAPWMLRNLNQFGTLLAPGGFRAIWIISYDEIYTYPASLLTFSRWRQAGLDQMLYARLWALGQNLQTALAVQSAILLAPFIMIALWRQRQDLRVRIGGIAWVSIFFVMTIIFPYQGARGGFLHASATLQPLFWALAPIGLQHTINWIGVKRSWQLSHANHFFMTGSLGILILLTFLVNFPRFMRADDNPAAWNERYVRYQETEQQLIDWEAGPEEVVMVNNPPGYYIANRRPAISIPNGDLETVIELAERYHVSVLLLEIDQIKGHSELFMKPSDQANLDYLGTVADARIYRFMLP